MSKNADVARRRFPSQNVQNTPFSDHFLEDQKPKKCTPLWREAHFQVRTHRAHHFRTNVGRSNAKKMHAVVARRTFPSQIDR